MGSITVSKEGHKVFDIRQSEIKSFILEEIQKQLHPAGGAEKQLPTLLLYDERGLKLFEDITYLEEYYLTSVELGLLDRFARRIAERIPSGVQLIELGSGNLRKTNLLLKALDESGKDVDYYALDLSLSELDRTLSANPPGTFRHLKCYGLYGTYDDGLEWLKLPRNRFRPKVVMSMGSSIGNMERQQGATFLRSFASLLQPSDMMLVGVDGCLDKQKVYPAYNDKEGVTHEFYRNGLRHANTVLGFDLFKQDDWEIVGEFDEHYGRHQAFVSPRKDVDSHGFSFVAGERIRLENSYKYSRAQRSTLWSESGLTLKVSYADKLSHYSLNLLSPPIMALSLDPSVYVATPIPSLEDFRQLWKTWDFVSQEMLPHEELLSKPINLRNCCLFYLGHIPAFFDIHLTRATCGEPTAPASYHQMFERGIDPDVDNPERCHAHSELPKEWPSAKELLNYQVNVRERAVALYENGMVDENKAVGKAMWLGFEHEAMHIETFLYMLLQSDKILPPPGARPDFEALAHEARFNSSPNKWISIPNRTITIGLDEKKDGFWGWDNEKPVRTATVPPFEAKARPLTNGDYAKYLAESGKDLIPKSWIVEPSNNHREDDGSVINGHADFAHSDFFSCKFVRTLYGPVPLILALDWAVVGSYDELASCADWFGGRIPTMKEARSMYAHAEELKAKASRHVHATPDRPEPAKSAAPNQLHTDLHGCNVSFANFHPLPVMLGTEELAGLSGLGGVWEWTSTPLEKHDGFEAMEEYPAYTADFFDGKHNIVLGGSWATHSRIAGRKSFTNWYQRNYPYAWVGARLVRDVQN